HALLPSSVSTTSIISFMMPRPRRSTLFPYTTLFRSKRRPALTGPEHFLRRWRQLSLKDRKRRSTATNWTTPAATASPSTNFPGRSEEHTSELQSRENLVCRLLLEKKKKRQQRTNGRA